MRLRGRASIPGTPGIPSWPQRRVFRLRRAHCDSCAAHDPALAALALVALEAEAFLSRHRTGPLALNAIVVAVMAIAALGRRRHPIAFLLVVDGLAGLWPEV